MRKLRVLALVASLGLFGGACTAHQKAQFLCRVKYGISARPTFDRHGGVSCYRIGTAIHVVVK